MNYSMIRDAGREVENQKRCSCLCHTTEDKEKAVCASCLWRDLQDEMFRRGMLN